MLTPDYELYNPEHWVGERTAEPSENRRALMVDDIGGHLRRGMP